MWKGEEQVLLLRAGPFRSCSAASLRSGRLSFSAEISGHKLVSRSAPSWEKQDMEKAIAGAG